LSGAIVEEAQFEDANLAGAVMTNPDLRKARGLVSSQLLKACLDTTTIEFPSDIEVDWGAFERPSGCTP